MHAPVARGFSFAALLCIAAMAASATPGFSSPVGKDGLRKETQSELLRKSLDFSVSLELSDTPLASVVQQLGDLAKVNIVVDRSVVLMSGDPSDMLVSLKAREMKLRTALRTVTSQHGLTFAVVGDHILVSSEEIVNHRQLRQRVSVDLDGETLAKAVKDLAQTTATNIVIDPRSQKAAGDAKLTLHLDDVPMETAIRLMAEVAGLKPVRMGNVLFLTTDERAEKLKSEGETPTAPNAGPNRGVMVDNGPIPAAPMILPAGGGAPAPAVPRG